MVETSVIIRCFNEQKHLPALFDALAIQDYRDFEVIVVDSGSLDRSREIAQARADRLIRISSHDFTFGFSLNTGIRAAQGRFMAIVSAHTVPDSPHWLGNLVASLRDDRVAMTYGRQIGKPCSKFAECEDFERNFGPHPRVEDPRKWCVNNANSAIRKDLWERYPFDETLTGLEDIDWARHWMERGYEVRYRPDAPLLHIHEETWGQIRRRYHREAVAWRKMGLKSKWSAIGEVADELGRTLADMARAFAPGANPVARRLSLGQRLREIVYFRVHRNLGAVRGLLETHAMETQAERQSAYFDRPGRAVVIHGPGKASLDMVDLPEVKPGDALIQVAHVAVCATDHEILNGTLGYFHNGLGRYPIVPGHEFSGRIAALGRNVANLAEGDAVVVECIQGCGVCPQCRADNAIGCPERTELGVLKRNGAYADYVVVPARFVHRVPAGTGLRAAALAEPLAVVLKGLRRLSPALADRRGGHRCLVIGGGPIGHMAAKVLAHRGEAVTVHDRNPERLALFRGTGIATAGDLAVLADHHVVVEATGNPDVLDRALHDSPANAALLLLGLPYGRRAFSFEAIAAYDKTVVGSVGSTARDFDEALGLLDSLDLGAYFECALPLESFRDAWARSKTGDVLKVFLDIDPNI